MESKLREELVHISNNQPVESTLLNYKAAQELIKQRVVEIKEGKYQLTELGKKSYEFNIKRK
jgi:hypothetical protein